MATAFQPNAFQNNAFQIVVAPPPPPPPWPGAIEWQRPAGIDAEEDDEEVLAMFHKLTM
jgi:hypothetical protein